MRPTACPPLDLAALFDGDPSEEVGAQLPCRSHHPDLFFAESPADVERAKTICQPCPVRPACLSAALERREPWGVWGGELFADGVIVPRKRPRGRPRKEDQAPAVTGPPVTGTGASPSNGAAA